MQLYLYPQQLTLAHPFTISRGTMTQQETLIVELRGDGVSGWGEVTQNSYYGHTIESLTSSLTAARELLPEYVDNKPEAVWDKAVQLLRGDLFAVSALDMAAHDWRARRDSLPTWRWWGLDWNNVPASSYTIAMDSIDVMLRKLEEQPNWPVYKIKLGGSQDLEMVRALRSATPAVFRVDANCGWSVQQTIELSQALSELNVEFIEQPLPASAPREHHRSVYEHSALPVVADESCQRESDVAECAGLFHGINIKLCKCGGLSPALRMLRQAKHLGMKTMVGCMIESSIAISAAAQLLPLLDYADLDGATLLSDDPAQGVVIDNGVARLSHVHGHGAGLM
ncbi:MAG: dipeptide epimerase [Pirellulaceae bacterium]|nr:dipeptide epimerase [Pirellulaceae bacterium]